MAKAIILDRDGVLNEDKGYVHKVEDFRLYPGVVEGLKLLKGRYLFFIITNQSGIGKGYYTEEDFHNFNNHLVSELGRHGIKIERTYYCPHRQEDGCDCRKPSLKYAAKIASEYGVELEKSWVVGDHPSDIEMGKKAGCKTAYVLTGHGAKHYGELEARGLVPSIVAADFLSIAKRIAREP
ncbi:MAG: HAD family hydrolase [Candidatus Micrarchaeota archaeon]|nr:HAD family hydrolase [Candidatus Micrarchaeota archaeon]